MQQLEQETLFAPPEEVTSLEDCWFYHTMEVPGYGLVKGPWDLRPGIEAYLGEVDLRGQRVLELGTASGFVGFHMERQGAEVIAVNLAPEFAHQQNWVPFVEDDAATFLEGKRIALRHLNNGFWLCHRALESSIKMVYGDVYQVPEEIGTVDIATFGCLLLHLRDPFLALERNLRLVRQTVVITEPDWGPVLPADFLPLSPFSSAPSGWRAWCGGMLDRLLLGGRLQNRQEALQRWEDQLRRQHERLRSLPLMTFLPEPRRREPKDGWWLLRPQLLCAFLGVLGFGQTRVTYHTQLLRGDPSPMFTVVGQRTTSA